GDLFQKRWILGWCWGGHRPRVLFFGLFSAEFVFYAKNAIKRDVTRPACVNSVVSYAVSKF
ncbi:unnamed protein product, partial [Larinioides sclopetarius]